MKSVRVFPNSEEIAEEIARSWCEQVRKAVNNCGTFSVVLSGGSHDPVLYRRLTEPKWRDSIPWGLVHIFLQTNVVFHQTITKATIGRSAGIC